MSEFTKRSALPAWVPPWTPQGVEERARRQKDKTPEATYQAGCHCGAISLEVTLSPPIEQGHPVCSCTCSICACLGCLLVYPDRNKVKWRQNDRDLCKTYRFNTGKVDHLFCGECGTSLGVDFRESFLPAFDGYAINIRTIDNIDLENISLCSIDGKNLVPPVGDASGRHLQEEARKGHHVE